MFSLLWLLRFVHHKMPRCIAAPASCNGAQWSRPEINSRGPRLTVDKVSHVSPTLYPFSTQTLQRLSKSTVLFVGFLPLVGATSRKSPSPSFSDHPAFRAIQDLAATFPLHRDLCANLPASAANATTPTGRNHWWAASCPKSPGGEHFWKNLHPKKKRNTKQNPKTQIHYGSLENLDWSLIGLLFVGENRCWPRSGANHPRHTRPSADSVEVQVPAGSLGFSGIPDLQLENPPFLLGSNVAPFKHHKKIPTGFSIYHGNHQICQLHSGRWLAVKQIPINLSLTRLWKGERWGGIKAWRNLLNSR